VRFRYNESNRQNASFIDLTIPQLSIGYGRIENISAVYQASRIYYQLNNENTHKSEDLFPLADLIRSFRYNNTLDNRYRNIEIETAYLTALKAAGYDLENFYQITNALDAFRFENPSFLGSGYEIKLGISRTISISEDLTNNAIQFNTALNFDLPINAHFHLHNQFSSNTVFSNFTRLRLFNRLQYFPSNRTILSLSQTVNYQSNLGTRFFSYLITGNGTYFVSPRTSFIGTLLFQPTGNIDFELTGFKLTGTIGIRHFII